ncbi:MAG: DUF2059 domain-containing protein [Azospirillaceae bacterium]|nr:DUF2059 domain-containing protein [Azospirillaceae bacterium]
MLKKITAGLIGVSLLMAAPAWAQTATSTPKTLELARTLVEKTNAVGLVQQLLPTMVQPLAARIKAANPGREAEVQGLVDKELVPGFKQALDPIFEKIIQLYAEHFTEGELQAILAFYETPAGRKLRSEMPSLVQQTITESRTTLTQSVTPVALNFMAECQKAGLTIPH